MGARNWHLARSQHCKEVADHLAETPKYRDWAAVALFYGALHLVQSALADEPDLPKDERHPRKHTGRDSGIRGTNQLVSDLYKPVKKDYWSLFEISRRTRYDFEKLGADAYRKLEEQYRHVEHYVRMMNMTRPEISTEEP